MSCREKEKESRAADGQKEEEEGEETKEMREMMGFSSFGTNKKK